ncbi:MAG: efflux RND transporter periplasmic adaptor subunit [Anaerolineales bacterium]|nr:efflux RND transporter periplasmic adaptor subunit [Anaerolineales bacterium]
MQKNIRRFLPLILILAVIGFTYYYLNWVARDDNGALTASGTVEAVEVIMAAESGGRVAEVLVSAGQAVRSGQELFRLEDELLQAQRQRAVTTLASAEAGQAVALAAVGSAQAAVDSAQIQLELALTSARTAAAPARTSAWQQPAPDDFETPSWYFTQDENLAAALVEVDSAAATLRTERANFEQLLASASNADLVTAESRLVQAQAAYLVAQSVLLQAEAQPDQQVRTVAQENFDAAQAELESAQLAYDQLLTEQASQELLEGRARLAVAQERYDSALDRASQLRSGEDSLQVAAARAALQQAEANLAQVQASLEQAGRTIAQAEAELALIDLQIAHLTIFSPIDGLVLSRNIEPGEIAQPGGAALTLVDLSSLTLTVYVPEDRYGEVRLGALVAVRVDSFPGETFQAEVLRIAGQAEYTPRNVQTAEGRRSTVFAIELAVQDPGGKLKPGMPADVTFQP